MRTQALVATAALSLLGVAFFATPAAWAGAPPQGYVGDPPQGDSQTLDRRAPYADPGRPGDQQGYDRGRGYEDQQDDRYGARGGSYEERWREEQRVDSRYGSGEPGAGEASGGESWSASAYRARWSYQSGGWNAGGYIEPCDPRPRDANGRPADCPTELTLRDSFFAYGEGSVGPTWLGAGGGGGGGFAVAGGGASASASASARVSVSVSVRIGGRMGGSHGGGHGGGCGCHH